MRICVTVLLYHCFVLSQPRVLINVQPTQAISLRTNIICSGSEDPKGKGGPRVGFGR